MEESREPVLNEESSGDTLSGDNPPSSDAPTLRGYRAVCVRLGLSMCVFFVCRFLASGAIRLLAQVGGIDNALYSVLHYTIITVLVYIVPIVISSLIFKYRRLPLRELYRKPRRLARALGTFPATLGLGHGVALLTLLITYMLSRISGGETFIEDLLRPTTIQATSSIAEIVMMVVLLVVVAPIFEEYWVRGIMFDALRPYGAGMAILISSLIFGLMHGSLYMLFYTTAYGLALGYIRYATGSLFTTTILHAIVNSIGAITLVLISLTEITQEQNRVINTITMIYSIAIIVMIIIGVIVFFSKIPAIRKYRFDNPWTEIGPWKKIGMFFMSIPIIAMLILAFNELTGYFLIDLILS